ncbi:18881_t:CDS:2, partial [Racocetra fulgida]
YIKVKHLLYHERPAISTGVEKAIAVKIRKSKKISQDNDYIFNNDDVELAEIHINQLSQFVEEFVANEENKEFELNILFDINEEMNSITQVAKKLREIIGDSDAYIKVKHLLYHERPAISTGVPKEIIAEINQNYHLDPLQLRSYLSTHFDLQDITPKQIYYWWSVSIQSKYQKHKDPICSAIILLQEQFQDFQISEESNILNIVESDNENDLAIEEIERKIEKYEQFIQHVREKYEA